MGQGWIGGIGGHWGFELGDCSYVADLKTESNENRLEDPWNEQPKNLELAFFGTWRAKHLSGLSDGHRGLDQATPACSSIWT